MVDSVRANCPEWALRIYDILAPLAVVAAAYMLVSASNPEVVEAARTLERSWRDFAVAAVLPAALLATRWLSRRHGRRDEDEYLRRLIGHASVTGVIVTIVTWATWDVLAPSWVNPPTSDQIVAVLIGISALAYGAARLRGLS